MAEQDQHRGEEPIPRDVEETGKFLVTLKAGEVDKGLDELSELGVATDATIEGTETADPGQLEDQQTTIALTDIGVVVVKEISEEQIGEIMAAADDDSTALESVERETYVAVIQEQGDRERSVEDTFAEGESLGGILAEEAAPPSGQLPMEYLRGYQDAIKNLVENAGELAKVEELAPAAFSETQFTWGLQATKAHTSRFSGRRMRVAILDTGFDLGHPDFRGRNIVHQSFVPGQPVQDGHGHGTHVTGTACGPRKPFRNSGGTPPSYGCAPNTEIFTGKVLSNQGSGSDSQILAGIQWAIANRCVTISMSLGRELRPGETQFSQAFEQAAKTALQRGSLIIAAAGNGSARPGTIRPVAHPANCPSIMAVGAIDKNFHITFFSNGGVIINPPGGEINVVGPGDDVYSSWPRPQLYRRLRGTSMATPHVSGIGALWAETNNKFRGIALARQLMHTARKLPGIPVRDQGAGLVQAP